MTDPTPLSVPDKTSFSDHEVAAVLIEKYGYLVFSWCEELKPGAIINSCEVAGAQPLGQPFVVLTETTRAEYNEHNNLIEALQGLPPSGDDPEEWPHYYRVTTD